MISSYEFYLVLLSALFAAVTIMYVRVYARWILQRSTLQTHLGSAVETAREIEDKLQRGQEDGSV